MKKNFQTILLAGAAAGAVMAFAGAAHAQEAPPSNDTTLASNDADIIVTARKRSESAQSVPIAIDALTSADLVAANVTNIDDMKRFSSDLNIRTRADNTADVSMRGVGSFGLTPGVGFYVDDVQVFEGQTARFSDIQQVEILKGPQGTLYGGASIGGAIKYSTKLPTDKFEAEGTIEGGGYNSFYGNAIVSGKLTDGLNARVNYFHNSTDGFIYNSVTNSSKAGLTDEDGLRITLDHPGATHITLHFTMDLIDTGNSNLYRVAANPDDAGLSITHGQPDWFARKLYSGSLNIRRDIGDDLELSSITSGFVSDSDTSTDVDKTALPTVQSVGVTHREVYSQEIRVGTTGSGAFQWLVGGFVQANDYRKVLTSTTFFRFPATPANLADPTAYRKSASNVQQKSRTYAVFASASYNTGPWAFELGARFGRDELTLSDPRSSLFPVGSPSTVQNNGNVVLPRGSISYKFAPKVMGYATISRGATPGGAYEGFTSANIPYLQTYKSEKTWNYEVGLKSTIFGGVRLNADAFYIRYTDRLFQFTALQGGGGNIVTVNNNIGPSTNYGVEGDLSIPVTRSLNLVASGSWLHAVWDHALFFDANTNTTIDLKDKQVPWAPKYQARVGFNWSHEFANDFRFGLRGDIAFTGRQYYYPSAIYSGDPFHLINVGASIEKGPFRLYGSVSNLENHIYNQSFISGPEIGSPRNSSQIAAPRLWSIGLTFKY
jgi:iron complex outermembrane receptor protein